MISEKISVIIIEDDPKALSYLTSILDSKFKEIDIIGTSDSIIEGIKLINNCTPDILFLDIELKDGLSFEILNAVESTHFEVIFTTAYNNYYKMAMEHFAFHYLLKPIDPDLLKKVINHYKEVKKHYFTESKYKHFKNFIQTQNSKILLHVGNEHISVKIDEIVSCNADGNYTTFILKDGKNLLVSHILKYYNDLLSHRGFFRANRSCLINTSHIQSIYKKETICMDNGDKIHVSTRNKGELNKLIDSLI